MKLDSPEFKAVFTPELDTLAEIFRKSGYEIRIAGGAVRDLLMKRIPHDIDFATTATPAQMKEMFTAANIRMLNTNGERHGTITARINDKANFEVTTLRIDVCTDGRHANVEFTTDWMLDANRRDLTINSLFLGLDGTIYDYFDGVKDIEERRVRFVGDASVRIKEDFLRILRYFRFFGVINAKPDSHDPKTIKSITENAVGLKGISGERIQMEFKKIVICPTAPHLLKIMADCGLFPYIGLRNCESRVPDFEVVHSRSLALSPLPITLITSLLADAKMADLFRERIKLSNDDKATIRMILLYRDGLLTKRERHIGHQLKTFLDLTIDEMDNDKKSRDRIIELLKYCGLETILKEYENTELPVFPVNGCMLAALGIKKGPNYKIILRKLRDKWKSQNYEPDANELLQDIQTVLEELSPTKHLKNKSS